jgi:hypothetical protein
MIFAMGADGMTFRENPACCSRMRASHFSDQEKSRLYALGGENTGLSP